MAYIGNKADSGFTSLIKQDLTGASGTSLTLTHAVANANDIALYINNVRQEPVSAYSTNGTAVSLTGSVVSSDDIYVIYLARAVQTTVPPDGSVSTAKIADSAVSTAKIANSAVNLTSKVTGVLPIANGGTGLASKPIYQGYRAAQYSTTSSIIPTDVRINQGGHYNTSTHVWTCPKNGFYVVGVNGIDNAAINIHLRKNGVKWKTSIYATQTSGWASYADHEVLQLTANDTLDHYLVTGRIYSDSDHYYQAYIYLLE